MLVDTGGWAPDAKGMAAQVTEQAELAVAAADAVVFLSSMRPLGCRTSTRLS